MKITDKSTSAIEFTEEKGYLVKRSHLARLGSMEYSGEEVGKKPGDLYQVETSKEELFNPKTIASYEGMPVTLLHPAGLTVDAKNWKEFSIGHVQNVAPNGEYLDGDVFVSDAAAIETINKHKIKEISCGQDVEIIEENGKLKKTQIVGNHVAIVPSGRAGRSCRLGDKENPMKNRKTLADSLKKLLGMSKKIGDAELSPEEKSDLEAAIAEMQAALEALPADAAPETIEELKAKIAELQSQLDTQATVDKKTVDEDPKDAQIAELQAKIAELEKENADLKEAQAKAGAVADASTRFPSVKVGDAKNARAVYTAVLVDSKAFNDAQIQTMSDAEIKAAYAGLCAVKSQAKSNVGKKLLGDAKPEKVNLTQKFGGKK